MRKGKPGTKKKPGKPAATARKSASAKRASGVKSPARPAAAAQKPASKSGSGASSGTKKSAAPARPAATKSPAAAAVPATKSAAKASAKRPAPVAPPPPENRVEAPPKFRREYKKWLERLISLRRKLHAEGERLGEEGLKAVEQEVSVDHMADFGSDSYEQDTTLALIENKSEALRDVDAAIRRIENRTYGLCEECEQMIPAGRLEVLPHARYCVTCQARREGAGM